jgi:hypothetical protein
MLVGVTHHHSWTAVTVILADEDGGGWRQYQNFMHVPRGTSRNFGPYAIPPLVDEQDLS